MNLLLKLSVTVLFVAAGVVHSGVGIAQRHTGLFDGVTFDRVILTETDYPSPEPVGGPDFSPGSKLSPGFMSAADNRSRVTITKPEGDTLYRRLIARRSYRAGASVCFEPRLDVFFIKGDTLVNRVEICIACNRLQSGLRIPVAEALTPDGLNPKGMTPAFRRYLSRLIARYGFSHGADGSSIWDKN